MTRYEIDGRAFSTLDGFFDEISRVLIPYASWGRNLDAFNDILRGGFGTPKDGFMFVWTHHAVSRERLGYPETVRQLALTLARCHPSNRDAVVAQLEAARSETGPTVFDWLVHVLRDHGPRGDGAGDRIELVLA